MIIRHFRDYFRYESTGGERAFWQIFCFNHLVDGVDTCSEWNAENTGPSRPMRSWLSYFRPTVFRPLQKKITERCTEFIAMLSSTSVRKSNQHLQANEEIGTSFQLEMISQFLWKKSSRESSLNRECDFSGESNVLSMQQWVFRSWESIQNMRFLSQWPMLNMDHLRALKQ